MTINLGWARAVNTFLLGLAAGVMLLLSVVDMIWPVLQQRGLVHTVPLLLVGAAVVAVLDYAVGSFDLDAALARLARGSDSGGTLRDSTAATKGTTGRMKQKTESGHFDSWRTLSIILLITN